MGRQLEALATTPDSLDASLRVALARAVARTDRAILIDRQNRAVLDARGRPRRCRIEEALAAIENGEAATLAVDVTTSVLAVDADRNGASDAVATLASACRAGGARPVVLASGGLGRFHLFARMGDPVALARLADLAHDLQLDVRGDGRGGGSGPIRPPGAPHRSGAVVRLVEPASWIAALDGLAPCGEPAIEPPSTIPGLSPCMAHLLRWREHPDGRRYGDVEWADWRIVQAVLTGAANAGASFDDVQHALLDGHNAGGAKVQRMAADRGEGAARRWMRRAYVAACRLVERRPARRGGPAAQEARTTLDRIDAAARACPWPGRAGATDLAVLRAIIGLARQAGKLTLPIAVRTMAERGGVTWPTVIRSGRRLRAAGWVVTASHGQDVTRAGVWHLRRPSGGDATLPVPAVGGGGKKTGNGESPPADVWRWGAIGPMGRRVWETLGTTPVSVATLAVALARPGRNGKRALRRLLARLAACGLAVHEVDGWRRGPADPATAAQGTRAEGATARQQHQHDVDRATYRADLQHRRAAQSSTFERTDLPQSTGAAS